MRTALHIIVAVVIGESSLIVLTTLAQEVVFDGIDYQSSNMEIVVGGGLTIIAALLTGVIVRLVDRKERIIPVYLISLLVMAETL